MNPETAAMAARPEPPRPPTPEPTVPPSPEPADLATQALTATLTIHVPVPRRMLQELYPARLLRQPLPLEKTQPLQASLALLEENGKGLWLTHLTYTLPYPGRPRDWQRRLLPLRHYPEYQAKLNRLLETRIALLLEISRRTWEAVAQLPPEKDRPSLALLTAVLRRETHAAWQTAPAPSRAEFLAAAQRRRPWFRKAAATQAAAQRQYGQALAAVQKHQPTGPQAARAYQEYQQAAGQEQDRWERQNLLSHLPGAQLFHRRRAPPREKPEKKPPSQTPNPEKEKGQF